MSVDKRLDALEERLKSSVHDQMMMYDRMGLEQRARDRDRRLLQVLNERIGDIFGIIDQLHIDTGNAIKKTHIENENQPLLPDDAYDWPGGSDGMLHDLACPKCCSNNLKYTGTSEFINERAYDGRGKVYLAEFLCNECNHWFMVNDASKRETE